MKPMHPRDRCAKIVRDCEQLIRDVEWWNRNRTDAPPMDCEPERVLLPVARACLKAWDSGDLGKVGALSHEMVSLSVRAVRDAGRDGGGEGG